MNDACDRQRLMAESVAAHQRLLEFLHRVSIPITAEERVELGRLISAAALAHKILTNTYGRAVELTF